MLYCLYDARYIGWTYPGEVWTEPNVANQDAGTARVLRQWSKQMFALERSEPSDRALGEAAQRICIDFFTNTILVLVDREEEALVCDIRANRKAWSDSSVCDIARARIVALASLYAKSCKTNKRRVVELHFQNALRGPIDPFEARDATTKGSDQQWADAMNEFSLGAVVNLLFRPPLYSSYLPHDRFDKLLEVLKACVEAHPQSKEPMGLLCNPNPPPAPAPGATPPSAQEENGPVRKHDKGPRAARWAGPRPRVGGLHGGRVGAEPARPRDEGAKMASIEAGKLRARQLRAAEQARVAELWERQRIVSLGFAIGQGAD